MPTILGRYVAILGVCDWGLAMSHAVHVLFSVQFSGTSNKFGGLPLCKAYDTHVRQGLAKMVSTKGISIQDALSHLSDVDASQLLILSSQVSSRNDKWKSSDSRGHKRSRNDSWNSYYNSHSSNYYWNQELGHPLGRATAESHHEPPPVDTSPTIPAAHSPESPDSAEAVRAPRVVHPEPLADTSVIALADLHRLLSSYFGIRLLVKASAFFHVAQPFGASSSVINYCRVSQALAHLGRILLALILINFLDDYFAPERASSVDSGYEAWRWLHVILGLGISTSGGSLHLSLPEEKKAKIIDKIQEALSEDRLSSSAAAKLAGRLLFASTVLPSNACRPYLREAFPQCARLAFYSDATSAGGIGAVASAKDFVRPIYAACEAPEWFHARLLDRKTQIIALELFAALVSIETFGRYMSGRWVIVFVDNVAVEQALVKGYSKHADLNHMITKFWHSCEKFHLKIWIDRVPSELNPADKPSRRIFDEIFFRDSFSPSSPGSRCFFRGWTVFFPSLRLLRVVPMADQAPLEPSVAAQEICTWLLKSGFQTWEEVGSEVSDDDIQTVVTTGHADLLRMFVARANSGSLRGPIWELLISTATRLQSRSTSRTSLEAEGLQPRQVPGWMKTQASSKGAASVLGGLADAVGSLRYKCVSQSSLRQYASGLRCYVRFAVTALDLSKAALPKVTPYFQHARTWFCLWLSTFRNQDTAKCYLTHLRKWHEWLDLSKKWDTIAVRQTAQGLSRNPRKTLAEKPRVSIQMLRNMVKRAIGRGLIDFSLAAIMGYHFLLRIPSELLVASVGQLIVNDSAKEVTLVLPRRKNLPAGDKQVRSCCCKTDSLTCPVEAAKALLERRGSSLLDGDPLFPLLSYRAFLFILRSTLSGMGVGDAESFGSHALRRGAASDLAKSGSSFQQICALGSWRSRVPASVYVDLAEVQKLASSTFMSLLEESDSESGEV
ncbi:hypothetical protein FOZ60_010829 [Perkinsus olseni]|uniref:Uncharacterized protein n=2 Tax=Perkinsus olseni TaxID=32597 RepID=A0A7J6NEE4_PEROL|nr:hypothetical protein FOZ60_010829 [Perkinsus olseni]